MKVKTYLVIAHMFERIGMALTGRGISWIERLADRAWNICCYALNRASAINTEKTGANCLLR